MKVLQDGCYEAVVNMPLTGVQYNQASLIKAIDLFLKNNPLGELGKTYHYIAGADNTIDFTQAILNETKLLDRALLAQEKFLTVNLVNVSHEIKNLTIDSGGDLICRFKPLNTLGGDVLNSLISQGHHPKLMMRAVLKNDTDKDVIVQSIIAIDVVNDPY